MVSWMNLLRKTIRQKTSKRAFRPPVLKIHLLQEIFLGPLGYVFKIYFKAG